MKFGEMDPMFVPANPTGIRPPNDPQEDQMEDDEMRELADRAVYDGEAAGQLEGEFERRATVEDIPVCGCTGEQLERLCAEAFGGKPHRVPDKVRCPCGFEHRIGPGLDRC